MSVSAAPGLRAALRAGLVARAVAGLVITYGAPSRKVGKDALYLQGVASDEESAAIGNLRREEEFVLTALVSVVRAFADDPQPVTERAFALYEEMADLLRDDMTVAGTVRTAEPVGWTLTELGDPDAGWREAAITARIRCKARI